jgi:hypothetical protein
MLSSNQLIVCLCLTTKKKNIRYGGLAHGQYVKKVTVCGISNCLNYCVIFIVYPYFTNVVARRTIRSTRIRPWVRDPCLRSHIFLQSTRPLNGQLFRPQFVRHRACRLSNEETSHKYFSLQVKCWLFWSHFNPNRKM